MDNNKRQKGRINSEVLSAFESHRGVNKVCWTAGHTAARLREIQQEMRAVKNYELADRLRTLADDLDNANDYLMVKYRE